MQLLLHGSQFAVIRLEPDAAVPAWVGEEGFVSITRTPAELSIICPESKVPANVLALCGWTLIEVKGPLDLSDSGILHALLTPLAQDEVAVLTVGTHDTDFLLVRDAEAACTALVRGGCEVVRLDA